MFEPGFKDGEFGGLVNEFPADDAIPETLIPFLEYLLRDCGPQAQGMLDTFNAWVASDPERPAGSVVQSDPEAPPGAHPHLGDFDFGLRGVEVHSQAFSNVVHHFQRLADIVAGLGDDGRAKFETLVARTGGARLMSTTLARRTKSEHYGVQLA